MCIRDSRRGLPYGLACAWLRQSGPHRPHSGAGRGAQADTADRLTVLAPIRFEIVFQIGIGRQKPTLTCLMTNGMLAAAY